MSYIIAAAELNISDIIGKGSVSYKEIAKKANTDEESTFR